MKKRILVLLLALVMVAGFALPAVASEGELVSDEPVVTADEAAPAATDEETPAPTETPAPVEESAPISAEAEALPAAVSVSDGEAPATTQDPVPYVDENGNAQTATGYTVVTNDMTTLGVSGQTTWYVVKENVTISGERNFVDGTVHLILCDGATLTVNRSILISSGSKKDASLTIYGQSGQTGVLSFGGMQICSETSGAGRMTINGGSVTVTGGVTINGNSMYSGAALTVNGGSLSVTNSSGGGIWIVGQSSSGSPGTMTINGGTVIAESTLDGSKAINCNKELSKAGILNLPDAYYWRTAADGNYKTQNVPYTDSDLEGKYFELTTTKPASNIEPTVTGAAATVTYGDTPNGSVITASTSPAGTFAWKDDVTGYGPVGTKKLMATFTPNDISYAAVDVEVSVTVKAKDLTVTAKDHCITYGDVPGNNGVSYSGFVTGEDESKLTGTLAYDYNYSRFDNAGSYSITPKGLTSDNYNIKFQSGTLTVEPKTIGIDWTDTELTHNGKPQKPTATATGLVTGDECTITVTGEQTEAGRYTATAAGLDNPNYKLPENVTCEFTIKAAPTTDSQKEPPKTEKAPQTGDAGIALYVISALGSMTGLAWLGRKKR